MSNLADVRSSKRPLPHMTCLSPSPPVLNKLRTISQLHRYLKMYNNPASFIRESSVSSISQSDASEEEKQTQLFAKQMLQGRLFIGTFQEKRYVDSLRAYRDVIAVAAEEMELVRDLEVVRKRLRSFYVDQWTGITGPDVIGAPVGHCIWTELPDEIFGSYWYKISKIRFRANEILLKLKVVRPVTSGVNDPPTVIKSSLNVSQRNADGEDNASETPLESLHISFAAAKDYMLNGISSFISNVATIQNTKEALKFTSVLVAAVVTGSVQLLQFLCDFTLKFMREVSFFVRTTTPIIIAVTNLIAKIVGGFYLLILSMWRDRKGPPAVYQSPYVNRNNRMLTNDGGYGYNTVYFRRALPRPPRQQYGGGVRITPLD